MEQGSIRWSPDFAGMPRHRSMHATGTLPGGRSRHDKLRHRQGMPSAAERPRHCFRRIGRRGGLVQPLRDLGLIPFGQLPHHRHQEFGFAGLDFRHMPAARGAAGRRISRNIQARMKPAFDKALNEARRPRRMLPGAAAACASVSKPSSREIVPLVCRSMSRMPSGGAYVTGWFAPSLGSVFIAAGGLCSTST